MKIAIPVDKKDLNEKLAEHFGRATYFLIYDTETKDSKFIENSAATSSGGAGIKAAQTVVDEGVEALITPRCGKNAAEVIKEADIKMYQSKDKTIQENIDDLIGGGLSLLEEIHSGFHGGR
ncbi:MAG: dinitrogenase iron-molybdenum cofactor biosynthesis protein [Tissierellia bacterium]|nr:dinitrogenase iron-molybdenum cofactor biosynthesis protein [Tissierellia bacterium]